VNFSTIYKVFDTVVSVLDAKKDETREREQTAAGVSAKPAPSLADQVEARLTNVVVAALKEAFDRDHARLELERAHLDEQRRRAEESVRLELQRQTVDREISRLRLLALAGVAGWIAAIVLLVLESQDLPRIILIGACALLLGAIGSAFTAQTNGAARIEENANGKNTPGTASLWLLLAGFALAAISLVF
jgi:hypothetical protein